MVGYSSGATVAGDNIEGFGVRKTEQVVGEAAVVK